MSKERTGRTLMAYPTKYSPEVHAQIVAAIRAGNTREGAAKAARICKRTLYNWFEEPDKVHLLYDIETAEGELEQELVGIVRDVALSGNWQAAMTMLERRHPDRYSRREGRELSGEVAVTQVVIRPFADGEGAGISETGQDG